MNQLLAMIKCLVRTEELFYPANELICKENMPISSIICVNEGFVKLVNSVDNQDVLQQLVRAEYFLGLSDQFIDVRYNSSAISISPVKLCAIDLVDFKQCMANNLEMAFELIKYTYTVERTNSLNHISLLKLPIEERFHQFLIWLSESVFKSHEFELLLNRTEIACFLGTSHRTLSRMLEHLRKNNIIATQGKKFTILKPSGKIIAT